MAPLNRAGVAAVFAADAHFKMGANGSAVFNRLLHQLTNTVAIQLLEGVLGKNSFLNIANEEVAFSVITAVAEGHLGQVVRAKGEEFSQTSDFRGCHSGARDF